MFRQALWKTAHTHMERLSSDLQEFVFAASSVLDEMSSPCVCRACEVSAKDCMKKRNGAEAFKCRWQVQRHQCSVPSCTQKSVSMSMYFQQS